MGGVRTATRGLGFNGVMDCGTINAPSCLRRPQLPAVSRLSPWASLPFALGVGFPSLSSVLCLPWVAGIRVGGDLGAFSWRGFGFPSLAWLAGIRLPSCGIAWLAWLGFPWAFGWRGFRCLAGLRGLASLGKRAENFFEEKACTRRKSRFYVYHATGTPGSEPQKNTMTTQDLQNAEASAFAAKQSAFRSYSAAVGTEAEQAASEAYHSAVLAYARALDAWMGARKGGAL